MAHLAQAHLALARRRLRLQDLAGRRCTRCWPSCRAPPIPALLVGSETADDAAVYRVSRRPGDRLDGRLLHPDRRRPVRLRPDRRDQRAVRRLRDGRAADHGAEPRRVLARRSSAARCCATILRGGSDVGGRGRRRGRRRALDRRPRAEVRDGGHRHGAPGPRCCATRPRAPATSCGCRSRSAAAWPPRRRSAGWRPAELIARDRRGDDDAERATRAARRWRRARRRPPT